MNLRLYNEDEIDMDDKIFKNWAYHRNNDDKWKKIYENKSFRYRQSNDV